MRRALQGSLAAVAVIAGTVLTAALTFQPAAHAAGSFIGGFNTISTVGSTVPKHGDVNPYGMALVQSTQGNLVAGDVLISNFNNHRNLQGTGTTIVQVSPSGATTTFADLSANKLPGPCPGGIGLTTALVELQNGWVVVGSLPSKTGSSANMQAGCLVVINSVGRPVETIAGAPINGPWDMTAMDGTTSATLFVTNVLNDTVADSPNTTNGGTVVRVDLSLPAHGNPVVGGETVIANGLAERTDPNALVVGPTGLGLGSDGTLYVADSVMNRIVSVANAGSANPGPVTPVTRNGALDDPLGLVIDPNSGDIVTANGADGNLVETTTSGDQVAVKTVDTTPAPPGPNGNGALFGLALTPGANGVYYVDDATNTMNLLN
jgi:hypothetical protein